MLQSLPFEPRTALARMFGTFFLPPAASLEESLSSSDRSKFIFQCNQMVQVIVNEERLNSIP